MDERKLFDTSQLLIVSMVAVGLAAQVGTITSVLFSAIIPVVPFVALALLVSFGGYTRRKRYAVYGAEMSAILILLFSYSWLYLRSSSSLGGTDVGMGLLMMSLPLVLVVLMVVGWLVGESLWLRRASATGTGDTL